MLSKQQAAEHIQWAKAEHGLSWKELADAVGQPPLWTTSALLGQHPMSREQASAAVAACKLDGDLADDVTTALTMPPYRGLSADIQSDPTIYRFYEALGVYGSAMKELVSEEFGDGIMSAINFRMDLKRVEDPAGDRVVITFDGKFLPYQW